MTLRTRLLLSLGALLAVVLVVTGGALVGVTRQSLVAQVDDLLLSAVPGDVFGPGGGPGPGDPTGRRLALLVFDERGELVRSLASGSPRRPDPLPAVATPASLPRRGIFELPSVDRSISYRAVAVEQGGMVVVLGASLAEVEASTRALVRNLALIGVAAMIALLIAGLVIIRRGLRPLERMTSTAERISGGELGLRLGMRPDGSEVARLGAAFDSMLDQIQRAFDEQRAALAAKDASERRLRQFVADASHELRTPLTALRGYSDLFQAGGLEDQAALDQAMSRIGGESRRMVALVEDLLLLARLDQGRPLRRDRVDLSALLADVVVDARALEPSRPLAVEVQPGVTVDGDDDRLRQVVGNLLANVRVHTPPDAPIEVSLSRTDGRCVRRVVDHGPGIPPDRAARIFDRFYRGDAGRSRDRGGSGLGLSIAAAIVLAHGGRVDHSETPGGGATFTVELPLTG